MLPRLRYLCCVLYCHVGNCPVNDRIVLWRYVAASQLTNDEYCICRDVPIEWLTLGLLREFKWSSLCSHLMRFFFTRMLKTEEGTLCHLISFVEIRLYVLFMKEIHPSIQDSGIEKKKKKKKTVFYIIKYFILWNTKFYFTAYFIEHCWIDKIKTIHKKKVYLPSREHWKSTIIGGCIDP